jgi:hypothetical protein
VTERPAAKRFAVIQRWRRQLRRAWSRVGASYAGSGRAWNGALILLSLAAATIWVLVYTDWGAAIVGFATLFALYAGLVAASFFKKKKGGEYAIPQKSLSSSWWLLLPTALLVLWGITLLWATIKFEVLQKDFQSVVVVREPDGRGRERREAPSQNAAVKIRVPMWRTDSYSVGTDALTARPFRLNRWRVNRIFLPDDLKRWQIYFKPTPALSRTAAKNLWRLRVAKDGKDLAVVDPYRGEGIVVGGDDDVNLQPPRDSTIRFEARSMLLPTDRVEVIVEFQNPSSQWIPYTQAVASPSQKRGTREVEFDAPH